MKNKVVAGLLAVLVGGFGLHWFYLNRSGLGILHLFFCWTPFAWISGLISGIVFLMMDQRIFNEKYNIDFARPDYSRFDTDYERVKNYNHAPEYSHGHSNFKKTKPVSLKQDRKMAAMLKEEGRRRFKTYDLDGAIDQFEKAMEFEPANPALYFDLACCHSLLENTDRAYYYIENAVTNGFSDFDKIKTDDALAYLRVHSEFSTFESNGYSLIAKTAKKVADSTDNDLLKSTPNLFDQLKKLKALRDSGQLTETTFQEEKRKLFD